MDEFSIELSRGLYQQSMSFERRQARYEANPVRTLDHASTPRFLISKINLRSVSHFMLGILFFASCAMVISSYRAVDFLSEQLSQHSSNGQTRIVQSKNLEIIIREILSAEKEQFASELGKTKKNRNDFIVEKSQLIQQYVASLEHYLRASPSLELLNTFQVAFSEWQLQHEEWAQKYSFGDADSSYAQYETESQVYTERLYSSAYSLSGTMQDLQRRELVRIERSTEFFKTCSKNIEPAS